MGALEQLQALLRDLFQYDCADLDFGIYRLLRLKRDDVEAFLTEQLPRRVDEAFHGAAGEERGKLEKELAELTTRSICGTSWMPWPRSSTTQWAGAMRSSPTR